MATSKELVNFILKNQPLLTEEQAQKVASHFHEKHLPDKHIFLQQGKISDEYFYLKEGIIRTYTYNTEGEEITTGLFSNDSIVCEAMSFFRRIPAMENYETLTPCTVWHITFEGLQIPFHTLPEFREFGRALLVNEYSKLKMRTLSTLHHTAEERYADLLKKDPEIFKVVPLKYIASYLGITDTSLSRIRREFAKK